MPFRTMGSRSTTNTRSILLPPPLERPLQYQRYIAGSHSLSGETLTHCQLEQNCSR